MAVGAFVEAPSKTWAQGLYEVSAEQKHFLGTVRHLSDGRAFVYAKAGATNLSAGVLVQGPAAVSNHIGQDVKVAASAGDKTVVMGIGATALSQNQYKEGYLLVSANTGAGHAYKIRGHGAYSASSTGVVIELYDSLRTSLVAGTTPSKVDLCPHPCRGVVIHPSPPTAILIGVTPCAVPANYYFWAQFRGVCAVLIDGSLTAGTYVCPSDATDGAVEVASSTVLPYGAIGRVTHVASGASYALIDLAI